MTQYTETLQKIQRLQRIQNMQDNATFLRNWAMFQKVIHNAKMKVGLI